jgi:hypothetical protein
MGMLMHLKVKSVNTFWNPLRRPPTTLVFFHHHFAHLFGKLLPKKLPEKNNFLSTCSTENMADYGQFHGARFHFICHVCLGFFHFPLSVFV